MIPRSPLVGNPASSARSISHEAFGDGLQGDRCDQVGLVLCQGWRKARMGTAQIALNFLFDDRRTWGADWIWGCPLIVLTVIMHVLCIGYINQKAILIYGSIVKHHYATVGF